MQHASAVILAQVNENLIDIVKFKQFAEINNCVILCFSIESSLTTSTNRPFAIYSALHVYEAN